MTTYSLPRRLTGPTWEDTFSSDCGLLDTSGRWSRRVVEDGLCLDFSRVEFADFAALARALLLLDAAVRDGVAAGVVLPTAELSTAERTHLARWTDIGNPNVETLRNRLARRARVRGDTRAFMRQVGFEDALTPAHWPLGAVTIVDADGTADGRHTYTPAVYTEERPYRQRRLLTFRWFQSDDDQRVRTQFLPDLVAALCDIGMSRSDAQALGQELIAELVHNITTHAGVDGMRPPAALVGGVLLEPDTYAQRGEDRSDQVRELIDCATSTVSKVLQLVVGDSGTGFARLAAGQETGLAGVIRAFDRRQHEVHGLWRVARLVRTYRGRVEIRSADGSVGKLFGRAMMGVDITRSGLGHWPGTLVEVDVLTDPRVPQELAGSWPGERDDVNLMVVNCALDPQQGLTDGDQRAIVDAARRAELANTVTGLIVTVTQPGHHQHASESLTQAVLSRVLESQIANPLAVIVVFPDAPPRILEVSIAGLHAVQDGEPSTSDYAGERNTVLVLGSHGPAHWCGGPAPLRRMLSLLIEANGSRARSDTLRLWLSAGGDVAASGGCCATSRTSSSRQAIRFCCASLRTTCCAPCVRRWTGNSPVRSRTAVPALPSARSELPRCE